MKIIIWLGMIGMVTIFSASGRAAPLEKAALAAGCFWGTEEYFRKIPGVKETVVGYEGGKAGVAYTDVGTGKTGNAETVEIMYDPAVVSYEELLTQFFKMHDPTTLNRQGNDVGTQYRSAVFYQNDQQKKIAEALMKKIEASGAWKAKLSTELRPAGTFTKAEKYHQKYLVSHVGGYDNHYVRDLSFEGAGAATGSAAHAANPAAGYPIKEVPSDEILKKQLDPEQYHVMREDGTEKPFVASNKYLHNEEAGIYVEAITGEVLFSSRNKYDSKTGWPSFWKPLVKENVVEKEDNTGFGTRTEVRSKHGNSHLGHVFDDGPKPTGRRYCMNSAALRFIPKARMKAEGYGQFLNEFEK